MCHCPLTMHGAWCCFVTADKMRNADCLGRAEVKRCRGPHQQGAGGGCRRLAGRRITPMGEWVRQKACLESWSRCMCLPDAVQERCVRREARLRMRKLLQLQASVRRALPSVRLIAHSARGLEHQRITRCQMPSAVVRAPNDGAQSGIGWMTLVAVTVDVQARFRCSTED